METNYLEKRKEAIAELAVFLSTKYSKMFLVTPSIKEGIGLAEQICIEAKNGAIWSWENKRIVFANSSVIEFYSGDRPERLRGPQCECALLIDSDKWKYPEAVDMVALGTRLGKALQVKV